MNPIREKLLLSLLTFYFYFEIALSQSTECASCAPRNFFREEFAVCNCREKEFCNQSTGQCESCGKCYDFWNDLTRATYENITTILKRLLETYEVDLEQLQRELASLQRKAEEEEKQFSGLKDSADAIHKNISDSLDEIKKLRTTLQGVEENLINGTVPTDLGFILESLNNYSVRINESLGNLDRIKDVSDKNKLQNFTEKLKEIHDHLENQTNSFPNIKNISLSLTFETEHDLNLLQSILELNQSSNENKFSENLSSELQWIEPNLLNLIEIMKNLYHADDTDLITDASTLRSSAREAKLKLQILLKEEEDFKRLLFLLKREKDQYETALRLRERLHEIDDKIAEIDYLLKTAEELNRLDQALGIYQNKLKELREEIRKVKKVESRLSQLLDEESELLTTLGDMKNDKSLGEIEEEIKSMMEEIDMITDKTISHCKVVLPTRKRNL